MSKASIALINAFSCSILRLARCSTTDKLSSSYISGRYAPRRRQNVFKKCSAVSFTRCSSFVKALTPFLNVCFNPSISEAGRS